MADRQTGECIRVGILTVSDTCSSGANHDKSGENLKLLVESGKFFEGSVVAKDIIPDELEVIKSKLLQWSDHLKLNLILTTGGTGFAPRDVTPEATKAVLEKEALGMTVAMMKGSLEITPLAMLSRIVCGSRGKTLIVNLPGSMKGSSECFQIVAQGIPHAVDLLGGQKLSVAKTHAALQAEGIKNTKKASDFELIKACAILRENMVHTLKESQASDQSQEWMAHSLTTTHANTATVPCPMLSSTCVHNLSPSPLVPSIATQQNSVTSRPSKQELSESNLLASLLSSVKSLMKTSSAYPTLTTTNCTSTDAALSEIFPSKSGGTSLLDTVSGVSSDEVVKMWERHNSFNKYMPPARQSMSQVQQREQFVKNYENCDLYSSTSENRSESSSWIEHAQASHYGESDEAPSYADSSKFSLPFLQSKRMEREMIQQCDSFTQSENHRAILASDRDAISTREIRVPEGAEQQHVVQIYLPCFRHQETQSSKNDESLDCCQISEHDALESVRVLERNTRENCCKEQKQPFVSESVDARVSSSVDVSNEITAGHDIPEEEEMANIGNAQETNGVVFPEIGNFSETSTKHSYANYFPDNHSTHERLLDDRDSTFSQNVKALSQETSAVYSSERFVDQQIARETEKEDHLFRWSKKNDVESSNNDLLTENTTSEDGSMSSKPSWPAQIKTAKIYNLQKHGELLYVPVGQKFKNFISKHSLLEGVTLHKGKREIKKQVIRLCRQNNTPEGSQSWKRGKEVLERNQLDDYFELTSEGKQEQMEVHGATRRDRYVVNWYMWCPGHGNCKRKCGAFGRCTNNCKGMLHKQDRHNCSLMVNLKLFLSDLSTWRVHISGSHVPPGSGVTWTPHPNSTHCPRQINRKKSDKTTKPGDVSTGQMGSSCSSQTFLDGRAEENLESGLVLPSLVNPMIPSKKRISRMLSSLKRRREVTRSKGQAHISKCYDGAPQLKQRQVASATACTGHAVSTDHLDAECTVDAADFTKGEACQNNIHSSHVYRPPSFTETSSTASELLLKLVTPTTDNELVHHSSRSSSACGNNLNMSNNASEDMNAGSYGISVEPYGYSRAQNSQPKEDLTKNEDKTYVHSLSSGFVERPETSAASAPQGQPPLSVYQQPFLSANTLSDILHEANHTQVPNFEDLSKTDLMNLSNCDLGLLLPPPEDFQSPPHFPNLQDSLEGMTNANQLAFQRTILESLAAVPDFQSSLQSCSSIDSGSLSLPTSGDNVSIPEPLPTYQEATAALAHHSSMSNEPK